MAERPETSMSVRTSATGPALQVKKTRTSNAPKKDVPPKAPRAKRSTAAATATKSSSKTNSPARPQTSHAATNNNDGDDLDKLVSGIKKITLVTNKQKQARAREAKKTSGTSTPTAEGQANAKSIPATPMVNSALPQGASDSSNGNETPKASNINKEPESEIKQEAPDTGLVNIPDADTAKVTTSTAVALPTTARTPPADNFVHYQPDGPIPEALLTPQQPLNWLPVNTGATPSPAMPENNGGAAITSPSPAKEEQQQQQPLTLPPADYALVSPSPMKRGDLPIFTPTSQIRFAAPRPGDQEVDEAVWEVPETPQ